MSDRPLTRCQGYFHLFLLHLDASQLARQFIIAWASWTVPVYDCVCNCEFSRCPWGGKQNLFLSLRRQQRSFPTYQVTSVLSRPSGKQPWAQSVSSQAHGTRLVFIRGFHTSSSVLRWAPQGCVVGVETIRMPYLIFP